VTVAHWLEVHDGLPPRYPDDACPECHRRPGSHGRDCPILLASLPPPPHHRPDALDKDSQETVAQARGQYLRMLGEAPDDPRTEQARVLSETIAREAERRRLVKDVETSRAEWDKIRARARSHGELYYFFRRVWYRLPFTGEPEVLFPELDNEIALTRGEWREWAKNHRKAGEEYMIDHIASMVPANEGETYEKWREGLKRRRQSWTTDTDAAVVNRSLSAPPRPAGPRSPARSRTGAARSARKQRPRSAPATRTASTPR
jgi:hypothetical protein